MAVLDGIEKIKFSAKEKEQIHLQNFLANFIVSGLDTNTHKILVTHFGVKALLPQNQEVVGPTGVDPTFSELIIAEAVRFVKSNFKGSDEDNKKVAEIRLEEEIRRHPKGYLGYIGRQQFINNHADFNGGRKVEFLAFRKKDDYDLNSTPGYVAVEVVD